MIKTKESKMMMKILLRKRVNKNKNKKKRIRNFKRKSLRKQSKWLIKQKKKTLQK